MTPQGGYDTGEDRRHEGLGRRPAGSLTVGPESGRAVRQGPANTALATRPSLASASPASPLSFPFAGVPLVAPLCPLDAGRLVSALRPLIPGGPGVLRSGCCAGCLWPPSWPGLALPPRTARAMARPGQEGRRGGLPGTGVGAGTSCLSLGSGGLIGICRGRTGRTPEVSCPGRMSPPSQM